MKKKILTAAICFALITPTYGHAFFGGGISGPLPVYNMDKTVDAATIATQIATAQQLETDLANLKNMDAHTAAANMDRIYNNLKQLVELQNQMNGMLTNYENMQYAWSQQYGDDDYSNMTPEEYAENARRLRESMDQSLYNAMLAQGFAQSNGDMTSALQNLLNASQTSEGALAAAQVGNQIAALQAQQMIQFQQMVIQSNQAQTEWMRYQLEKDKQAQALARQAFGSSSEAE